MSECVRMVVFCFALFVFSFEGSLKLKPRFTLHVPLKVINLSASVKNIIASNVMEIPSVQHLCHYEV